MSAKKHPLRPSARLKEKLYDNYSPSKALSPKRNSLEGDDNWSSVPTMVKAMKNASPQDVSRLDVSRELFN